MNISFGAALARFASASYFLMNMPSPSQQSTIMGLVADDDERGVASGISGVLWGLPDPRQKQLKN